jgi:hypothetical protein
MSSSTKSVAKDPIREVPLRDPGQSLREQTHDQFMEATLPWISVAVFAVIVAVAEWLRWLADAPYAPVSVTVAALGVAIVAAWRCRGAVRKLPQQKLGIKGERAVGQLLQATLSPRGYFVVHDIVIDDFNIDHAVIGPGGVFAIEVKTRSKPRRGDARVTYDGSHVLVDGLAPDRDPLVQARAGAKSLHHILERYTGQDVSVRPVVLFPGWYVEKQPRGVEVWVLNDKAFPQFLEHEPEALSLEQCRTLAEGLFRYVRDQLDR